MYIKLYIITFFLYIYNFINSIINYFCPIQYIKLYDNKDKNIIYYNRFKTFFIYILNIKLNGLIEFELYNNGIYNKLIYNGNNFKYYVKNFFKINKINYTLNYIIMNYDIIILKQNNNEIIINDIKNIIMKFLSYNTLFNTFDYIFKIYYPKININEEDIITINYKYIYKGKIYNNKKNVNLFDNINIIFS